MISFRELEPGLWPELERLFGEKGACGGCWCMWWRVERGGRLWEETKGEKAKKLMHELVISGKAHGILAFHQQLPIGWCSFGPRESFPRLARIKAYHRDDTAGLWCINCFFIDKLHRQKGLTRGLLNAAIQAMRRRGAKIIEAYPVTTTLQGKKLPPVFSWTGPYKIFAEAGFREIQRLSPTKPVVRLHLETPE